MQKLRVAIVHAERCSRAAERPDPAESKVAGDGSTLANGIVDRSVSTRAIVPEIGKCEGRCMLEIDRRAISARWRERVVRAIDCAGKRHR